MPLDFGSIAVYVLALLAVIVLGRVFLKPIKFILRLVLNTLLGGLVLIILNTFGGRIGIQIGVNPLTALIAGLLGLPGVLLLIAAKLIFGG